jgi:hypothetical protein
METIDKQPDELLRKDAHHMMDGTCIWYDRTANEHGDLVWGPTYQAVMILCKMASDIRAGIA